MHHKYQEMTAWEKKQLHFCNHLTNLNLKTLNLHFFFCKGEETSQMIS